MEMKLPYLYARFLLAVCKEAADAGMEYLYLLNKPRGTFDLVDLLEIRRRLCAYQVVAMACGKTLSLNLADLEALPPSPKDEALRALYTTWVREQHYWQPLNDPHAPALTTLRIQVDSLVKDEEDYAIYNFGTPGAREQSLMVKGLLVCDRWLYSQRLWDSLTLDKRECTATANAEKKLALLEIIAELILVCEAWPAYVPCEEAITNGAFLSDYDSGRLESTLQSWTRRPWINHNDPATTFLMRLQAAVTDVGTLAGKLAPRIKFPQR